MSLHPLEFLSAMKILLIRFSSIGDIVLTTPVARCLKQQLGATVHYLTKKAFSSLISPNPNIDRVFSFERNISDLLTALKAERYDYVIDLHNNLRSLKVKLALGRPASAFNKLNLEKWLLVNTGLNFLPDIHIVDRYLAAARHLKLRNDGLGLDHFIPDAAVIKLQDYSTQLIPEQFIAFVIGATHATKRLPREKMLDICRQSKRPIAILGGKQEAETGEFLASHAGGHVVNFCGQLSIHQSASVVGQSAVVISHDTGLMHIAAAFKKKIISVWGNTVPAFGMYPYYPTGLNSETRLEVPNLKCRPCSKIGYNACPKGHFKCMMDLDTGLIASMLNT